MAATLAKVPACVLKTGILTSLRNNSWARCSSKMPNNMSTFPFLCSVFRGKNSTFQRSGDRFVRLVDQGNCKMDTRQQSNYAFRGAVSTNNALEEQKHDNEEETAQETLRPDEDVVSVVPRADISGKCVVANTEIKAGTHLFTLYGDKLREPTPYTIQVASRAHIHPEGKLIFVNHSCSPNTRFQYTPSWDLYAVRDILPGEELTFDYTTTEWQMAQPFQCNCCSTKCIHKVQGFYFLNSEQKSEREGVISPVIRKQLQE
ncbi:Hypp8799 [Branchiostoma lanceolatum]|uniref:Hypp8799 protein n=1 Tax=Branchiostoma lanceolatum TaxID=7740 RepID=A0A8J9Z957_BRALA|nr:Hypp8799 [Branchiostoma lanceolatum]